MASRWGLLSRARGLARGSVTHSERAAEMRGGGLCNAPRPYHCGGGAVAGVQAYGSLRLKAPTVRTLWDTSNGTHSGKDSRIRGAKNTFSG
jgi:hypothetical protein